jgi:hypothetical protein
VRGGLGGLAALPNDAATLAVGETAPDTVSLTLGERELQAHLPNRTLGTDRLGFVRIVLGDGVKNVGIKTLTGCLLSPGGVHQLLFLSSRGQIATALYGLGKWPPTFTTESRANDQHIGQISGTFRMGS